MKCTDTHETFTERKMMLKKDKKQKMDKTNKQTRLLTLQIDVCTKYRP